MMQKRKEKPRLDGEWLRRVREEARRRKQQEHEDYPLLENPWIDLGGEG